MSSARIQGAPSPREGTSAAVVESSAGAPGTAAVDANARSLAERFVSVRAQTRRLCEPLQIEDFGAQSMPDVSPTKWHLAHTTWFFETFLLEALGEAPHHPAFKVLFNSYYNGVGEQFPRPRRGLLTRPTVAEVWAYREAVEARVLTRLEAGDLDDHALALLELGLHHEQQHQELMLTDLKHVFFHNPLLPSYRPPRAALAARAPEPRVTERRFVPFDGRVVAIGHDGDGFAFDNELPRHEVICPPFALCSRLTTVAEYRAFIADGGYQNPALWLSEGWSWVKEHAVAQPLYWLDEERGFTLRGARPLHPDAPVCHVSLYEADAFATWAGARLPREHELEVALAERPEVGTFVESGDLHPRPAASDDGIAQLFGDAWEWTASPYAAYPGFRPPPGAIGEYNGKFMCNQHVLRGGSCLTPRDHVRASYRNFFPAATRWQVSGIRLARDL